MKKKEKENLYDNILFIAIFLIWFGLIVYSWRNIDLSSNDDLVQSGFKIVPFCIALLLITEILFFYCTKDSYDFFNAKMLAICFGFLLNTVASFLILLIKVLIDLCFKIPISTLNTIVLVISGIVTFFALNYIAYKRLK